MKGTPSPQLKGTAHILQPKSHRIIPSRNWVSRQKINKKIRTMQGIRAHILKLDSTPSSCVALGKSLQFPVPHFHYLENAAL